jgi:hypothetical protein
MVMYNMSCFNIKMQPVPLDSGLKIDGYWVWCGSAIEEVGVGYHIYAARWPHAYPMFEGYILCSEIIRAFSKSICGPYEFVEKILPSGDTRNWDGRMAHNPAVVKWCDKYLLYYIASTYDDPLPAPDNIDKKHVMEIYGDIRIGMAMADHPTGPWTTLQSPILTPRPGYWDSNVVTNPAPCVVPDGRIFLYYRSNTRDGLRIGLAVADRPEGPYERVSDDPIMPDINVEDPFVWHNGICFEMIAKDMTGEITGEHNSGAHFLSENGIDWRAAENPKAYSKRITFSDGSSVQLGCLERPQLLFDDNGLPKCMFAAAADGPGGFKNAKNTWNIAIPMQERL